MKRYKFEVYIPKENVNELIDELNEIGALKYGNYDYVTSYHLVNGTFRPLQGSKPFIGEEGTINRGQELKLEFSCLEDQIKEVISVIRKIHPYEEPVINIIELINFTAE